jgi:catechol 2,3-dioxygenase-like lactoylglutathione lyase family enzyme
MFGVTQMGYATFETTDLERSVAYYTGVLGLAQIDRDEISAYVACPADFCSVVLTKGSQNALARLALQLGPAADLNAIASYLSHKGASVSRRSDAAPGISHVLSISDPSGLDIDLIATRIVTNTRHRTLGIVPRKLGHTALFTSEIQKTVKFYTEMLGFRVSDWIGDFFVFMRCNTDHHTVNFLSGAGPGLHHIAFELNDWNHVKQACDLLAEHGLQLIWGPGRHGPGHNIYTYHVNPDGFTVELFTELDQMSSEENGYFDPRPWHHDRPQRPKVWDPTAVRTRNLWGLGKPELPKEVGRYR